MCDRLPSLPYRIVNVRSALDHRETQRKPPSLGRRNRAAVSMEARMGRIAIIGAGAWGTGLSIVLGRKGTHQVRLWALEKEVRDSISSRRVNELFLPGYSIPNSVTVTGSLDEALQAAEIVVSVMPSQHCRGLFEQLPGR